MSDPRNPNYLPKALYQYEVAYEYDADGYLVEAEPEREAEWSSDREYDYQQLHSEGEQE